MDDLDYRERLAHDVAAWEREGLIQSAQRRAILARVGAGEAKAVGALRLGWLITAVSVIGALVMGAGVILLVGTNWDEIPGRTRTGMLMGAMLASYAAAYALMYRYDMQRIGSALLLLGYLIYVASVFLLPQIYSMPLCDPNQCDAPNPALILLAALGAFPLAYAFASRIVLLVGLVMLTIALIVELTTRYPDTPEAQASLIVIGAFGIGLYAIGRAHALRPAMEDYGDVYAFAGLFVALALVYLCSFGAFWDEVVSADFESFSAPNIVYIACGIATVLTLGQWLARGRGVENDIEVVVMISILAIGATVATWPEWSGYAFVFIAVYFVVAAGLVIRGYLLADERQVNLGLIVVALGLVTRYIDFFWDVEPRAVFFLTGGGLLLALAFGLERLRRNLISGMGSPPGQAASGAAEASS